MEQQVQQQFQYQQRPDQDDDDEDAQSVEVDEEFNVECLEAHNKCREHGCPPLELSIELAASAQAWADYLAKIGRLQHSTPNPRGSYGENIAMKMVSGSQEYKGSQCTAQWYSEIEMYDFNGGENQMKCGHFSQVVWKSTKEAGFGKAISPDGKMFAVGQYAPAGNFMNKWRANIPPPVSGYIEVPGREDIMGRSNGSSQQRQLPQQQQQQSINITKETAIQRDGEPAQKQQQPQRQVASADDDLVIQPTRFRRNFAAPPAKGGAGGDDVDGGEKESVEEFAEEAARQHNLVRRRHGAVELRRSPSLDRLAQSWAEKLRDSGRLSHARIDYDNSPVGQNIAKRPASAVASTARQAAQQLLQQWCAERHRFAFGQPDPEDICGGHFSQLVWCASEKLGVGLAEDSATGDQYAVCFYHPSGNLAAHFADNVLPSYE